MTATFEDRSMMVFSKSSGKRVSKVRRNAEPRARARARTLSSRDDTNDPALEPRASQLETHLDILTGALLALPARSRDGIDAVPRRARGRARLPRVRARREEVAPRHVDIASSARTTRALGLRRLLRRRPRVSVDVRRGRPVGGDVLRWNAHDFPPRRVPERGVPRRVPPAVARRAARPGVPARLGG